MVGLWRFVGDSVLRVWLSVMRLPLPHLLGSRVGVSGGGVVILYSDFLSRGRCIEDDMWYHTIFFILME